MNEKDNIKVLVNEFCSKLSEHVDSVQVFATFHEGGKEITSSYAAGKGNFFARKAQVAEWVIRQDEFVKEDARHEQRDEYGDDKS